MRSIERLDTGHTTYNPLVAQSYDYTVTAMVKAEDAVIIDAAMGIHLPNSLSSNTRAMYFFM